MDISDPKIVCFIIPHQQDLQESEQNQMMNDRAPLPNNYNGVLLNSADAIVSFQDIKQALIEKKEDCTQDTKLDLINGTVPRNKSTMVTSRPEGRSQNMKSGNENGIKRRSKYSYIYSCGTTDFVRQNPKLEVREKKKTRYQIPIQNFEAEAAEKSSQYSFTNTRPERIKVTGTKALNMNDIDGYSTIFFKRKRPLGDEGNVLFVHKILHILKYPKSKHHQDCAIGILRHDKELLRIFRREIKNLGEQRIPVFRKPIMQERNQIQEKSACSFTQCLMTNEYPNHSDMTSTVPPSSLTATQSSYSESLPYISSKLATSSDSNTIATSIQSVFQDDSRKRYEECPTGLNFSYENMSEKNIPHSESCQVNNSTCDISCIDLQGDERLISYPFLLNFD